MKVSLTKYLLRCGVGGKRKCKRLVKKGMLRVSGHIVTEVHTKVDTELDRIELDGSPLSLPPKVYLMLNKPWGYVVTARDELKRHTIYELLAGLPYRVFAVGRLDLKSEGLVLLTNDGQFASHLLHPENKVEKEYLIKVKGFPRAEVLEQLRQGIELEHGLHTLPCRIEFLLQAGEHSILRVGLCEGKRRQVRRMFGRFNYHVLRLKRLRIGNLRLGQLAPGEWRYLSASELEQLQEPASVGESRLTPSSLLPVQEG